MRADDIWASLVVQIAVVGGAKAGYSLLTSGAIDELLPRVLLRQSDRPGRLARIHAVLRQAGVRFVGARAPAAKARAVGALLEHPHVVEGERCIFAREVHAAAALADDEACLRRAIVGWALPGFGPKSTSDWLNNRGVTRDLIAFDVRVCAVLAAWIGERFRQERVARLAAYETAEAECRKHLARPLGCGLAAIDKRLFVAAARRADERAASPQA